MTRLAKKYQFKEIEKKWQEIWQEKETYKWDETAPRAENYVIDTPPPTVSGQLHIGHVYSYTHTDFIARYQRMKGMNVFYPMGFDDNGLPTERLVEKRHKVKASQLSRQEFSQICQKLIKEEEEKFQKLFAMIALSVDWRNKYQTISDQTCKLSQMSFLDLVDKGQIYRDSQPMLWDMVDQTALSQVDIEEQERTSRMYDLEFETEKGEKILIATTRPELLPACVAIFFHPDDQRYQKLAGQFAISPLFKVNIPIIADELVVPEKGTGLVMCCTFGDQTDILWWRKHQLPTKIIFTKYGTIDQFDCSKESLGAVRAEEFAKELIGLKIVAARSKIVELLRSENLLKGEIEKIQLVKCAERSGSPLEILTTPQWFIKSVIHKEAILEKSAQLNWFPKKMKIKLDSWVEKLSFDWCISRQRYFGVAFPVWYSKRAGEEGKILFASSEQLPVNPSIDLPIGYQRHEVTADTDIMDTWSTSSISPQLNSHSISSKFSADRERHAKLFPADLRPQAHEIIRSWAYYTMLKAHLHQATLPWQNIMISGWCLASNKDKMSKSKGNIIVPETILEQYGADIVRYWSASSKLGADTAYSEDVLKNGKKLVNKLWNAANFVCQYFDQLSDEDKNINSNQWQTSITAEFDQYFLMQLDLLLKEVTTDFANYEYASVMRKSEEFFWSLFCDNYLEISKKRAYDEMNKNPAGALSSRLTLYHSFHILLKLFAPFLPHITEELYCSLYDKDNSIHQRGSWPQNFAKLNHQTQNDLDGKILLSILELVRKTKAQKNLSIKAPIREIKLEKISLSASLLADLKNVTAAEQINSVESLTKEEKLITDELAIAIIF